MEKDYDSLIADNEMKKKDLVARMRTKKQIFIQAATDFSRQWFLKTAKKEITEHPEIAKEIGSERLKEIKDELNVLIKNVPDYILDYLNKKELWWHEKEEERMLYIRGRRLPDNLEKALRIMFGEKLGVLLAQDGFVKLKPGSNPNESYGVWAEVGSYQTYSKQPMYPYSLNVPDNLFTIINEYYSMISGAQRLNEELNRLKLEKEQSNISDIWDSL